MCEICRHSPSPRFHPLLMSYFDVSSFHPAIDFARTLAMKKSVLRKRWILFEKMRIRNLFAGRKKRNSCPVITRHEILRRRTVRYRIFVYSCTLEHWHYSLDVSVRSSCLFTTAEMLRTSSWARTGSLCDHTEKEILLRFN